MLMARPANCCGLSVFRFKVYERELLTPSVTHWPPMLTLPNHLELKIDDAPKRPAYLVSSNQGRSRLKPQSERSICSKVQR